MNYGVLAILQGHSRDIPGTKSIKIRRMSH
jgi:hypothetical protein